MNSQTQPQTVSMPLLDFILQGKISGYASGGEGQEKTFDDGHEVFNLQDMAIGI